MDPNLQWLRIVTVITCNELNICALPFLFKQSFFWLFFIGISHRKTNAVEPQGK